MAVHSTTAIGDRAVPRGASALRIRCKYPRGKLLPQIGGRNVRSALVRIDRCHPDKVRDRRALGADRCRLLALYHRQLTGYWCTALSGVRMIAFALIAAATSSRSNGSR